MKKIIFLLLLSNYIYSQGSFGIFPSYPFDSTSSHKNIYAVDDSITGNRDFYLQSNLLRFLDGSISFQGTDVIQSGDYDMAGTRDYPLRISHTGNSLLQLTNTGFLGSHIRFDNFSDNWEIGMDDDEGFFLEDTDATNRVWHAPDGGTSFSLFDQSYFTGTSLGIGHSTPYSILHLESSGPLITFTNNGQSPDEQDWEIGLKSNQLVIGNLSDIDSGPVTSIHMLTFDEAGYMLFGGDVAIGGLSVPTATLDLEDGTGTVVDIDQTGVTNANALSVDFSGGNVGSTGEENAIFRLTSNSTLRPLMSLGAGEVVVSGSGNLGLGIATPSAPLHVSATNAPAIIVNEATASIVDGTGYSIYPFTTSMYFDTKVQSGGNINFRYGEGAQSGATSLWMQVEDGRVKLPFGRLDVGSIVATGALDDKNEYGLLLFDNTTAILSYGFGIRSGTLVSNSGSQYDWDINGVTEMRLESDGDLQVEGDVVAFSTAVSSDRRLKKDIKRIEDALDKLKKINGVNYSWKDDSKGSASGVIAQDVEKVLPNAVKERSGLYSNKTYKTVDYNAVIALLVEATKEQQKEIESLKSEIEKLKK